MTKHTRSIRFGGTTVAGVVLLGLGGAAPVLATPPGGNGLISFMRQDSDGQWQVWVANPDLSGSVRITDGPSSNGWAVWSADGDQLAFDSDRSDPDLGDQDEVYDVFTMRPDGSDVRQVTDSVGLNGNPTWSPNGELIAFVSDRGAYPKGQGIYAISPDGDGLRRITTLPTTSTWQDAPRFSPDGTKLVFTEYRGGTVQKNRREGNLVGERSALFVVNVDGSGLHRVTPWGAHPGDADWSPDGTRLVFETVANHLGNASSVTVVNADGTHLLALTKDSGITGIGNCCAALRFEASFDPVWSPDGTKILFSHDYFTPEGEFTTGLQTIAPDGTGQAYISDLRGSEHQADWGTAQGPR